MENEYFRKPLNDTYLHAWDSSILAGNYPRLSRVKCVRNLQEAFDAVAEQKDEEVKDENIRVYLRIKNASNFGHLYEISENQLTSKVPEGSNFMRNIREGDSLKKFYTFTDIFPPDTTQKDLFDFIVKPKILDFINGQNSTLLTYGASGSGKTFTVIGTIENPGVVPRSLEYLFRTLPQLSKIPKVKPLATGEVSLLNDLERKKEKNLCQSLLNTSTCSMDRTQHLKTYQAMQQRLSSEPVAQLDQTHRQLSIGVWVSFVEIYNEHIYDLLQLDPPRGHQRPKLKLGQSQGRTYIKNVTSVNVTSGQEAYQILQYGIHNLNYAATNLNKHSSRSHSIFTIKLVQYSEGDDGRCISFFNFCDLAGSERLKKTNNKGERLKESNNINSSLLVLGRCIAAVRNLQKHNDHKLVPFRESKLTQLFQRALSGLEDIAMIVTISPSREMFDETQHVLNFAAVAKEIKVEHLVPIFKKKNRFSRLMEEDEEKSEMNNVVEMLQIELETQRAELETNHQMDIEHIKSVYEGILSDCKDNARLQLEQSEKILKAKYEFEIKFLKRRIADLEQELKNRKRNEVIEIASSDESDNEDDVFTGEQSLKKQLHIARRTIQDGVEICRELRTSHNRLEQQNLELMEKCDMYESQILKNKNTDSSESENEDVNENNTV